MNEQQTAWGTPVVYKSGTTFEIIRYGDVSMKIACGFKVISEVGAWVREKGGTMGAKKHNLLIGQYREIFLP